MAETRKLAAFLRRMWSDSASLPGPTRPHPSAAKRSDRSHHRRDDGRIVERTGDGVLIEFRSVVDAVRCAIEMQNGMIERNAGLPPERQTPRALRKASSARPCVSTALSVQSMQQQMGQGPGPGRSGRLGQPRAQQDTDPLGRPLRGREYGDDYTVKVPGEIDVQRARRIIEELRRRFGDVLRPQEELDYIERLLKDY
jgi:hypothetical protein